MNLRISMSNHRVMVMAAALMLSLSTNAQRVSGDSQIESVATQLSRVEAAMSKLAPFQLLGCWNRARISPLIGLTESESKGVQAAPYDPQDSTWLSLVQPGDLLISVDGEEIKLGAKGGGLIAGKARVPAFRQLRSHGRPYVEVYKNSEGRETSVVNPVRLECSASDISVTDGKSDRAGSRSFVGHLDYYGLNISSTRLALLSDDQLLAFLAWNHAFMSLRHETNADVWEFVTLIGNGRPSMYVYNSSGHEKIDWVTLTTLRAMNADLKAYGSMLSIVDRFDKAAGFPIWTDKRFIAAESGESPFGGEEKQARLADWVKLLEQDAHAPSPASLKFSNRMLSRHTWTPRTMPVRKYQTISEALQAFLGGAEAKEIAERYMSNFDSTLRPSEKAMAAHLEKAPPPKELQMLYIHHPTKRLVWVGRVKSAAEDDMCARAPDCSIIAIGPHVVARPSPTWAQELSSSLGEYKLEELK